MGKIPQNSSPGASNKYENNFIHLNSHNNALPWSLERFQRNYCISLKIVEYRNRLTNRKFIWIWKYWFNPSGEVYRGLGDVPKPTLLIEVKFSLNNQYTFLVTFLRAVFSGYFEPTDVFYIDRNSHNSGSVIKNVWHLYE